ncbi:MAG: hypothetical protein KGV46_03800 [Pasteurella sp.]|nr:hypothetical protein [Pasteurella sp.]
MKLRFLSSLLIFLSAYSPLSIIFVIQDFCWKTKEFLHPNIIYPIVIVSVISIILVFIFSKIKVKNSRPVATIISVSNKSGELINYSIPYMISFFAMDLSQPKQLLSFGFFMLMMFVLTIKTHNIFINPILAILGYNIYDVKYYKENEEQQAFFLIKGNRLKKDEQCRIVEVSEYLFLVTDRNPHI